jgi:hypothetical protein
VAKKSRPRSRGESWLRVREKALFGIARWTKAKERSSLEYRHIEDSMLRVLDDLLRCVPPEHWVRVLKLVYAAIANSLRNERRRAVAAR